MRIGVTYSPGTFTQAIYTNAAWHNGNWHHVVMVFGASTVYLYFDGTLATSASVGGSSIADRRVGYGGPILRQRTDIILRARLMS